MRNRLLRPEVDRRLLKDLPWGSPGRTFGAEGFHLYSSVLATGIKKISAQASSGGGDFKGPGCYLSSCNSRLTDFVRWPGLQTVSEP